MSTGGLKALGPAAVHALGGRFALQVERGPDVLPRPPNAPVDSRKANGREQKARALFQAGQPVLLQLLPQFFQRGELAFVPYAAEKTQLQR